MDLKLKRYFLLTSIFTFATLKLDTQHFELSFPPAELKKGLAYFKKGDFSFIHHNVAHRKQLLVAGQDLQLRLVGKMITEVFCSCNKGLFCPHLATALFALNQAVFHKDYNDVLTRSKSTRSKNALFEKPYQEARSVLLELIKLPKQSQRKKQLEAFFKNSGSSLEKALIQICLLHELDPITEAELLRSTKDAIELKLKKTFQKGLDIKQKEFWWQAAMCSLRSNGAVSSGVFEILVPPLILMKLTVLHFAELEHVLQKRKFQQFHREGPDSLQVLRHQVGFAHKLPPRREWKKLSDWDLIALADLFYLKKQFVKALAVLRIVVDLPNAKRDVPFLTVLYFGLHKCRAAKDVNGELYFLKLVLKNALQADEAVMERMRDLAGAKEYRELMLAIAKATPDDLIDKKTDLYLASANHEALLFFAKHSPLRATKFIQVLEASLPLVPNDIVARLSKKVTDGLREAPNQEMQFVLIESLHRYRNHLSSKDAEAVLLKIRELVGQRSHLADLLN